MRFTAAIALASALLTGLAACQQQPEPASAPGPAVEPAPAAPVTAEQRREELQVDSAQRQIEAQMQAQLDAQAAAPDKSDH